MGSVYGVGINDADYKIKRTESIEGKSITVFECPFYKKWKDLIRRCYSSKFHESNPTYFDCEVCDSWLSFMNFKSWMETQEWNNLELDKDLLVPFNRIYSPETCIFIDARLNSFLNLSQTGQYLIGTRFKHDRDKFEARILDLKTNKRIHLGHFNKNIEAHRAWQKSKLEQIEYLMGEYSDVRVVNSLSRIYCALKSEYELGQITTRLQ